jgi:hypothetical protein
MTIKDLVERLERLHPDLPSQVRVSTVVESHGSTHPHAQCPRVFDGYDTLVTTRGTHESAPFSRLTAPLGCRYCEESLTNASTVAFYAEQFSSVLRAADLIDSASACTTALLQAVLVELTPSIPVPKSAVALALHGLAPVLTTTQLAAGALVFAYRTDDAAQQHLTDAVAHFANGYSLLLIDKEAAECLSVSSTAILEPVVIADHVTLDEAIRAASHIDALLDAGLAPRAALEAALSLSAA